MLEQRVGKLGEKIERIETILVRLEPQIVEILRTGAKQADVTKLQQDMAEVNGRLVGIEGRFTGLEGRFSGLDYRINSLPTDWAMLGIVFTTWALGSGILIFAMNYLRK